MIERHVTLSKTMEGLDHKISLDFEELSLLRNHVNNIVGSLKIKKDIFEEEYAARKNYHVGVYAMSDLKKGDLLKIGRNIKLQQPAGDFKINLTGLDITSMNHKFELKTDIKQGERILKSQIMQI